MRSWWFIGAALVAACGSDRRGPTDRAVCAKLTTLCAAHGEVECLTATDWRDMARDLGAKPVEKFRTCVVAATDCPLLAACLVELGADAIRKLDANQRKKLGFDDDEPIGPVDPSPDRPVPTPTPLAPTPVVPAPADGGAGPTPTPVAPTPADRDAGPTPVAPVADPPPTTGDGRPAVKFDAVTLRLAPSAFGHELSVSIELTVTGPMPHVAPHVTVEAACDGHTDTTDAFFMSLSRAEVGDRRTDTVKLFESADLRTVPAQCEVVLGMTEGPTAPARYCLLGGATSPGACPPPAP